jgi:hypothetical protein
MKYFNEDTTYLNAECEKCGRVLRILREKCSPTDNGYKVAPAAKCQCGNISDTILKDESIKIPAYSAPPQNTPKCPTCGSINIQKISGASKVAKVALFGIFAVGAVGKTFKCNKCGYQW